MAVTLVAVSALLLLAPVRAQRVLGSISVQNAGFSNVYVDETATDPREKYSILLSSFDPTPFTVDPSFYIKHVGKYLDNLSQAEVRVLFDEFTWPREPAQTPDDVFGFPTITQPDGFLVPFKNDGSIYVVDMRDDTRPVTYDIAYNFFEPNTWFFHRVQWADVTGDGRKDAITARTFVDIFSGEVISELVFYRHPPSPFAVTWSATIINSNIADTMNAMVTLNGINALFTCGYFSQKLAVHWSTHPNGLWTNPSDVQTRILGEVGRYFDVKVTDVNNDGRLDLLVPINAEVNGSLVVFEIPDDFRTGEYVMHMLASGFNARSGSQNGGAPGGAETFYPGPSTTGKPDILLSGDDEGTAYYLSPVSQDPSNWQYDLITIRDEGPENIVGKPSTADVDGDGYNEVFIPVYTRSQLFVHTFKP